MEENREGEGYRGEVERGERCRGIVGRRGRGGRANS